MVLLDIFFIVFYHIWAFRPSGACYLDLKLLFPKAKDVSHVIWFRTRFLKEKMVIYMYIALGPVTGNPQGTELIYININLLSL